MLTYGENYYIIVLESNSIIKVVLLMTKLQLKEKYSKWNIKNGHISRERNNTIFHEMQELSAEIGLPRYCSMPTLLLQLIGTSKENVALRLYGEYHSNLGRQESLRELAVATDNFKI